MEEGLRQRLGQLEIFHFISRADAQRKQYVQTLLAAHIHQSREVAKTYIVHIFSPDGHTQHIDAQASMLPSEEVWIYGQTVQAALFEVVREIKERNLVWQNKSQHNSALRRYLHLFCQDIGYQT